MAKQVMMVVMMVALMAGTASATAYNDAASGSWTAPATWGAAGYPDDTPAQADTATVDSSNVLTNVDLTSDLTIVLDGGMLYGERDKNISRQIDAAILVKSQSTVRGYTGLWYPEANDNTHFNGVISDFDGANTGLLVFDHAWSSVFLNNTNAWTGGSRIDAGAVTATATNAMGTGGVTVNSGDRVALTVTADMGLGTGTVVVNGGNSTTATGLRFTVAQTYGQGGNPAQPSITIGTGGQLRSGYSGALDLDLTFGDGSMIYGSRWSDNYALNLTGDITITGEVEVYHDNGGNTTISGPVSGAGRFKKTNSRALILTHAGNTFSGGVHVMSGGTVYAQAAGSLGTGDVVVFGDGELELDAAGAMDPNASLYLLAGSAGFMDLDADNTVAGVNIGGTWDGVNDELLVGTGTWLPGGDYTSTAVGDPGNPSGMDLSGYMDLGGNTLTITEAAAPIPEPAGLGLIGLALLGLKRKRSRS